MKKRKNGRRKGANGERTVAKLLQDWWKTVAPGVQFARTPLSGGWSNANVRQGFHVSGDVVCTEEAFPFSVEIKRRENWSPEFLVSGKQSPVWGWWRQSLTQSIESKKEPMLWLRRNSERMRADGMKRLGASSPVWLVMVSKSFWDSIPGLPYPDVVWDADTLNRSGVDYWGILPVGIMSYRLLALDPKIFLK